jgi:1,4-dihydroxy-2-naphthoyl-CoA synthase
MMETLEGGYYKVKYTDIIYSSSDHIATIAFNRPKKRNAFRMQTLNELADAMDKASADPSIGVIILAAEGEKAFSAGGDLAEMHTLDAEGGRKFAEVLLKAAGSFLNSPKPVIAKVDGICLGGGHDIQLLCDFTIATERSSFGQTGPKYGLAPVWGGPQILPHLIGFKKAAEVTFLCKLYSAQEALDLGLISKVVPEKSLDKEIEAICNTLLERSPQATKILRGAFFKDIYSRLKRDLDEFAKLFGTAELCEGTTAFMEKRKPDWNQFR